MLFPENLLILNKYIFLIQLEDIYLYVKSNQNFRECPTTQPGLNSTWIY